MVLLLSLYCHHLCRTSSVSMISEDQHKSLMWEVLQLSCHSINFHVFVLCCIIQQSCVLRYIQYVLCVQE